MATLQVTFVSESAGYNNSLGWYNSRTGEAGIVFLNTNDDGPNAGISAGTTATIEVEQADIDAGYIGFFVIPNGASIYGTGADSLLNGPLTFDTKPNGDGQILDADGKKLRGEQGELIFTDRELNKHDTDYTSAHTGRQKHGDLDSDGADGITGRIAFEDLVRHSDRDYNDLVIDVQQLPDNQPPVVEDQVFQVAENSAVGTAIGAVAASDPDAGQTLSYAIVAGNDDGAFAINAATGEITIADASKLDFENPDLDSHDLTVQVTDSGAGALTDTAIVRIAVTDALPIVGTQGDDNLSGTNGDDVLLGDLGNDVLRGGADNDVLNGGVVADFQSDIGFRDTDRADYSAAASGVNVNLASGIAQDGDGGTDTLIGVEGVIGSVHDDVLTGGSDALVEYFRGGRGNDTIDGAGWSDRAEYMDATAGISVNPVALAPNTRSVTGDASVGTDTLINVEIVHGTDFADTYVATGFLSASQPGGLLSNFNAFEGRGGNDTITGNGGTRIEFTGATGAIEANLATGIATGDASVGTDTFTGVNSIRGTQFADRLLGGNPLLNGFEGFEGRGGNDTIEGGQGFDLAVYAFDGSISTGITVDLAAGNVTGDPILTGTDTLSGVEGVRGSHKDDSYDATGFSASSLNAGSLGPSGTYNEFEGMAGDDTITGNGNTRIIYTQAREGVSVNLDAGTAVGGASVGNDTMLGGIWAVRGSNFNDVLAGSAAGEYFEGRAGDDVIDGGGGFDVAAYDVGASGGGTFIANALGVFAATAPGLGTDILSNIVQITGTNFGDLFDGSASSLGHTFLAQGGNDTLVGSQGDDHLFGGAGNDFIDGGGGADWAFYDFGASGGGTFVADPAGGFTASAPGLGVDTLSGIESISGTNFGDLFDGSASLVGCKFYAWDGDDTLIGSQGSDILDGGSGFDRADYSGAPGAVYVDLSAVGSASDGAGGVDLLVNVEAITGSAFSDTLIGGWIDNRLEGGLGNDLLRGGQGADYIDGGPGLDRIDFDSLLDGWDTISGFEAVPGGDVIDIADVMQNWTSYAGGAGGSLASFVRLEASGSNAQLQIDTDGIAGPAFWQSLATLVGGAGLNLNTLLAQGNLDVGPTGGGGVTLIGTPGNDSLIGGPGNDTILADMGNDFLRGGAGNDLLDGGIVADLQSDVGFRDFDRVDYSTALGGVNVNLATGIAQDGEGGTDTLIGIEGVGGSPFDDVFTGSSTFAESFSGGAGSDTIYGAGGFDRAEYGNATSGVSIHLGAYSGPSDATAAASGDASVGTDTLVDVEQFNGSNFADTFTVGSFSSASSPGGFYTDLNTFLGGGGDDVVTGNGNTRLEYSGATAGVTVNLAEGIASGNSSVGTDSFTGVTQVRGSSFDDTLVGGNPAYNGFESFEGRGGNDSIDGAQGWDRADYAFDGAAMFGITVNLAAGTVTGDPAFTGSDSLSSIEAVRGTHLADVYNASGFSEFSTNAGSSGTLNEFEGMAGNDMITGNGNTRVSYSFAREAVNVDLQAGTAVGGASVGGDTFSGVNAARGSNFDDVLTGSAANDTLEGLYGNDLLRGGAGSDLLNGGVVADFQSDVGFRDTDRADYGTAIGGVNVNLASGLAQDGGGSTDTLIGIEGVIGSAYDDVLTGGSNAFVEYFRGGAGNDTIDGMSNPDRAEYMDATSGIVVNLTAVAPNVGTVTGDASVGTDTLINIEIVYGSDHADTYVATGFLSASQVGGFLSNFNAFEGRGGNDTITGNGGTRIEYTGATGGIVANLATGIATGDASVGTDTFSGVSSVRGSSFDDTLTGGNPLYNGFEAFDGRGGNDTIDGGQGWDRADYAFSAPVTAGLIVNLAAGTVTGDALFIGTDTLSGIESIRGTHLADVYDATGFSGSSTNAGWSGTLNEFEGAAGNDTIIGNGNTRASFAAAREGVSVDLQAGTAVGGASVGSDTFSGVNAATGSNFDDVLTGSASADSLNGLSGNDLLRGGAGNDFINGGSGSDRIDFDFPWDGVDTISGFEAVSGGDVIDIADLLQNWTTYAGGAGGLLADFVRLLPQGTDALLQGDPDGVAGTATWQTMATLLGGAGLNLDTLVSQGNLDVVAESSGVTLIGTTGNDSLIGGPGNDTILADLGNDFLRGGAGNDLLNGGIIADLQSDAGWRDFDRADYSTALAGVNVNLATGVAMDGEGGTDTLIGVEAVNGSAFNDVLIGSSAFQENFLGGAGDDTIHGAGGADRAEYANAGAGVTITLGASVGPGNSTATVTGDASVGADTLLDVEQFTGSNFADTFNVGSFLSDSQPGGFLSSFNTFEGRGGNDSISGNGNTRIEYTGAANGVIVNLAGSATSVLPGGDPSVGTDSFSGVNQVRGSSFNDTLTGSSTSNFNLEVFDGRGGNDTINGGAGWDRADYGFNGPITTGITVNLAAGTVTGDPVLTGSDTLLSIEMIRGSHLADTYSATGFSGTSANAGSIGTANEFEGMAGNDTITGNGNTRVAFGSAREGVTVDLQAGTAVGGASVGTDTIVSGVNQMRGSNFDDVLMGSNQGTTFAQVYEGWMGNDTFSGRGGYDQAVYLFEASQNGITVDMDAINAFTGTVVGDAGIGTDTLIDIVSVVGTFLNDYYDATGYNSTVSGLGTFNEFEGSWGDDTIIGNGNTRASFGGAPSGVTVDLAAGTAVGASIGSDSLSGVNAVRGSGFDDTLTGSGANETFEGRGGTDTIDGAGGSDLARYDVGASAAGNFIANAAGGFSATASGLGVDTLSNIEQIRGTSFGDLFDGSASALGYTFDSRGGNDTLIGSQGNDTLLGGDGSDLLRGGQGADAIDGGAGADRIDFDSLLDAGDAISGFEAVPGGDVLDIADLLQNWTSYAGGAGGPPADFVQVAAEGSDGLLQIDADGSATDQGWQTLATLIGGSALDFDTLLSQGNIDVLI